MLGCLASLMLTMALAKRVDHAWKLVRRAAGHRQERGALERIFAISVGVAARGLHVLVPDHPGPGAEPRAEQLAAWASATTTASSTTSTRRSSTCERRERRRREKALALERLPDLDLSGTEWPDLPHSEIVNAAIARARGRVNGYPDRHAAAVRRLLAERHGLAPEQIALGNGAAELLQSAALALLSAGDELVMPWPSYPLYPLLAAHAGATPVSVERRPTSAGAVTERTRAVVICNPNDPTGDLPAAPTSSARCCPALPEHVHVLLDEALVHFQDVEDIDACLRLVDAFPRLLVVRTFSKIYGLSGPARRLRGGLGRATCWRRSRRCSASTR